MGLISLSILSNVSDFISISLKDLDKRNDSQWALPHSPVAQISFKSAMKAKKLNENTLHQSWLPTPSQALWINIMTSQVVWDFDE